MITPTVTYITSFTVFLHVLKTKKKEVDSFLTKNCGLVIVIHPFWNIKCNLFIIRDTDYPLLWCVPPKIPTFLTLPLMHYMSFQPRRRKILLSLVYVGLVISSHPFPPDMIIHLFQNWAEIFRFLSSFLLFKM